jgi:hypothetical protein
VLVSRPGDQGQVQAPTGLGASALPLAEWHLAEVAAVVRGQPAPLDPALLAVVLRGMAELCRLVQARGPEAEAVPPVLFRDNPVIAEALGMWATRLACLSRERLAGAEGSPQR